MPPLAVRASVLHERQNAPAMMAAFERYRIVELPLKEAIKTQSEFIDRAGRSLTISKSRHNFSAITMCFRRCDKKRMAM
jgi:hypothetical protein